MEHCVAEAVQWKRMRFKNNKVWMALDARGAPLRRDGKGLIKYQLDQPHEYWVPPARIQELDAPEERLPASETARPEKPARLQKTDDTPLKDGILIHTDGASSGNPGPAGIGVVLRYKDQYKEIARAIGTTTNNVAELEAIRTALSAVKNRHLPVTLYTDSRYAWGLLTQNWKARQNQELVLQLRDLIKAFKELRILHIKGHAGHPDNERADRLAVGAIEKG